MQGCKVLLQACAPDFAWAYKTVVAAGLQPHQLGRIRMGLQEAAWERMEPHGADASVGEVVGVAGAVGTAGVAGDWAVRTVQQAEEWAVGATGGAGELGLEAEVAAALQGCSCLLVTQRQLCSPGFPVQRFDAVVDLGMPGSWAEVGSGAGERSGARAEAEAEGTGVGVGVGAMAGVSGSKGHSAFSVSPPSSAPSAPSAPSVLCAREWPGGWWQLQVRGRAHELHHLCTT